MMRFVKGKVNQTELFRIDVDVGEHFGKRFARLQEIGQGKFQALYSFFNRQVARVNSVARQLGDQIFLRLHNRNLAGQRS